jgi:DNA modification methylase
MSLAFTVFFYPTQFIKGLFFKSKPFYNKAEVLTPSYHKLFTGFIILWLAIQFILPLRHWFIKGDVLWTEEAHRMSWRMMLRTRSSKVLIKVYNKTQDKQFYINKDDYLTRKQQNMLSKPDGIWQFCQRLKKEYAAKGDDIEIYVDAKVSINGGAFKPLIDKNFDMATAEWDYFFHNDWVLLYEDD